MTTGIYNQAVASILDNYADAIEGGNTYRGSGTAHKGVAGTHSYSELAGLTISQTDTGSSVRYNPVILSDAIAAALVVTDAPPFFVLCLSQASLTGNVGAARKLTTHTQEDSEIAITPAFSDSLAVGDVFSTLEGFKRAPDNFDLEDEQASSDLGWDRYFSLHADSGVRHSLYGNNVQQFTTQLEIRMRFNKPVRSRNAEASALENIARLRAILTRGDVRDGTYTQLLEASSSPPEKDVETPDLIIVSDRYGLTYRMDVTYL